MFPYRRPANSSERGRRGRCQDAARSERAGAAAATPGSEGKGGWQEAWELLMAQSEETPDVQIESPRSEDSKPNLFRDSTPRRERIDDESSREGAVLGCDAESSLGDATSSLGDAESSLGDAKSSLGDAESSLGDV